MARARPSTPGSKQNGKRLPQYNALKRWYNVNRGKVKRPGGAINLPAAPANPTLIGVRPAERLSRARLYFVVEAVPDDIVRAALRGGADMVQLRAKGASDDEYWRRPRASARSTSTTRCSG